MGKSMVSGFDFPNKTNPLLIGFCYQLTSNQLMIVKVGWFLGLLALRHSYPAADPRQGKAEPPVDATAFMTWGSKTCDGLGEQCYIDTKPPIKITENGNEIATARDEKHAGWRKSIHNVGHSRCSWLWVPSWCGWMMDWKGLLCCFSWHQVFTC